MTHIKIISVPKSWKVSEVLKRLAKFCRVSLNGINLLHIEDSDNGRFHLRIGFNGFNTINKIKNAAEATSDRNVYKLKFMKTTILMTIMDNEQERFKVEKIQQNRNLNNLVLMISANERLDITDLAILAEQNKI